MKWRERLDLITTVAVLAAAVTIVGSYFRPAGQSPSRTPPALPKEPVSLDDAALTGQKSAKVGMLIFSDFECPFCARFAIDTFPIIATKYVDTGEVLVAFKHLPLEIHPSAEFAAQMAFCAGRQDKFWPMHDLIFANQQRLRPDDLAGHAQAIRLDEDQLKACLSDPQTESLVAQNAANAKELGVGSTPFFLIGAVQSDGKMLVKTMFSGARPVQEFETAFESVRAGL